MAIKLKVATIVETSFYVTLDADVLAADTLLFEDFVREGRGNYVEEARNSHPMWWEGSKRVLKLEDEVDINDIREGEL